MERHVSWILWEDRYPTTNYFFMCFAEIFWMNYSILWIICAMIFSICWRIQNKCKTEHYYLVRNSCLLGNLLGIMKIKCISAALYTVRADARGSAFLPFCFLYFNLKDRVKSVIMISPIIWFIYCKPFNSFFPLTINSEYFQKTSFFVTFFLPETTLGIQIVWKFISEGINE